MTVSLADVVDRTVDLLGAGIDNTALLPHLSAAAAVRIWIDDPGTITPSGRDACQAANASIGAIRDWQPGDLVVRSPGFPRYRQDIASALSTVESGFVTTAVNLWLETFGQRYPTVIITGTKGKSTVARMLASILERRQLVGNIGTPIWSLEPPADGTPIVCEISSYQAVDMTHRASLGVLTSLSEDHVSWHGSVERYHADKLGPLLRAERVLTVPVLAPELQLHTNLRISHRSPDAPLDALPSHMAANAGLAIDASRWLREDFDVAVVPNPARVIFDLPPLTGRLRELFCPDDHRWFDDSLASNPSGAAAAVSAFAGDDLWLVVGGIDRHVSAQPLIDAVRSTTGTVSVVAVPDNGSALVDQISSAGVDLEQSLTAPDVGVAVSLIRSHAVRPSTVLFSPAAPTPAYHGNWSDRSALFEAAVLESVSDPG